MADAARLAGPARRWHASLGVAAIGVAAALAVGMAAGYPSPATLLPAFLIVSAASIALAFAYPFGALMVMAASTILFLVFDLPGGQGINLIDALVPVLLVVSLFGSARAEADAGDRAVTDPGRQELFQATRRVTRAVIAFYLVAAASIVAMVCVGRLEPLVTSATTLIRAVEGLLLFPLGVWWFRSEHRIHLAIRAMLVASVFLAVIDSIALGTGAVARAGMVWFVNQTEDPIGGPNEAASTVLLLIALLAVRQSQQRQVRNLVLIGLALAVLVATASRSGLLACLTFAALVMPRVRFRWMVFAAIAVACAIPLVPQDYWTRLGRTLVMQRGTFEAYTSLIRVYGWKTAIDVFLHQPLLGVGYVAYSAVSGDYGQLRITGVPVDNFYLETAAGMGLFGLIALAVVIVRVFQLGAVVRRVAPAGTLGHVMARYHTPLWIGMLIVNLTGNNFVGIVVLGQIALWSAMLVRAGHMALEPKPS